MEIGTWNWPSTIQSELDYSTALIISCSSFNNGYKTLNWWTTSSCAKNKGDFNNIHIIDISTAFYPYLD